jgi:hypothetical protein
MPEEFIRILEIFTTNRTAFITLDNGECSEVFNLEIGNTQGNGPSPLQFNFCEQILFFKIELDSRIQSVFSANNTIPAMLRTKPYKDFALADRGQNFYDSNRETDKLEGFADDGTVMAKASPLALQAITQNLELFAGISGLRCNVDKSVILPFGCNGQIPAFLHEFGFPVVDSVTILGIKITGNNDDLIQNFDDKLQKVEKLRNFWSRFSLSLQGRVLVAKTFMLSQIGYLGCIINPSPAQLTRFED